jgi:hypothetical protein
MSDEAPGGDSPPPPPPYAGQLYAQPAPPPYAPPEPSNAFPPATTPWTPAVSPTSPKTPAALLYLLALGAVVLAVLLSASHSSGFAFNDHDTPLSATEKAVRVLLLATAAGDVVAAIALQLRQRWALLLSFALCAIWTSVALVALLHGLLQVAVMIGGVIATVFVSVWKLWQQDEVGRRGAAPPPPPW